MTADPQNSKISMDVRRKELLPGQQVVEGLTREDQNEFEEFEKDIIKKALKSRKLDLHRGHWSNFKTNRPPQRDPC